MRRSNRFYQRNVERFAIVHQPAGFSLVEMAIILVIIGILTQSIIVPLGNSLDKGRLRQTTLQLNALKQLIIGYLIVNGSLPCPIQLVAESIAVGQSNSGFAHTEQNCRIQSGGVPTALLGAVGSINSVGSLLDSWGRPLRYTVSLADHANAGVQNRPDWTTPGEATAVGAADLYADLVICHAFASRACPRDLKLADQISFVLLSTGADYSSSGLQQENLDGDTDFISAPVSVVGGVEFDDVITWSSRNELVYWLLRANWLP